MQTAPTAMAGAVYSMIVIHRLFPKIILFPVVGNNKISLSLRSKRYMYIAFWKET